MVEVMKGRRPTDVEIVEIVRLREKLAEGGDFRDEVVGMELEMEMCKLRKLILGQPVGRIIDHKRFERNRLAGEKLDGVTSVVSVYDSVAISDG